MASGQGHDETRRQGPGADEPTRPQLRSPSTPKPRQSAKYALERELGRGGMGVVHLARDLQLNRPVALKVLTDPLADDGEMRARFEREARAAARLNHPNIATIYEFGDQDRQCYIAMEYVPGRTLREVLSAEPVQSIPHIIELAVQIAEALAAAHAAGLVHRDLKPQNVMLTPEGRVKVLDFGVASVLEVERDRWPATTAETLTRLTQAHNLVGTPAYMAPEQVRGEPVDARADIFSLGVVLYELLAGRRPFEAQNMADLLSSILRDAPRPLGELRSDVPRELERVVTRCLEKDRSQRFSAATELLSALKTAGSAAAAPGAGREPPSVAVLPFANLSPDPENEFFAEGIAEEIINALCRVEALRVASRTSAFAYKGRNEDVRAIGRQLGVGCIVEGSVRKAGSRLRITAQLIDVASGYHLWSERYDREMADVFAIQDEIALSITQALRVVLSDREQRALAKPPTADVRAYELYLKGRQYAHDYKRRGWEFARGLFREAAAIDPSYVQAQAGIAECCALLYRIGVDPQANLAEAERCSRRAKDLAPDSAEAHVSRGMVLHLLGDEDGARQEFETAITLDPRLHSAWFQYGEACHEWGDLERAAELFKRAAQVRPEDYQAPIQLALIYRALGRRAESLEYNRLGLELIRKHLSVNPEYGRAICCGAVAWARVGDHQQALQWIERAAAIDPDEPHVIYDAACIHAVLGDTERALHYLERVIDSGWGYRGWIETDPDLAPLRDDPRFVALLARIPSA